MNILRFKYGYSAIAQYGLLLQNGSIFSFLFLFSWKKEKKYHNITHVKPSLDMNPNLEGGKTYPYDN